ncbi:hypothetical protein RHSIM_RhsimUnG0072300 [Rhododendron simsii]|uniref:Uncharacterized protein n=1 Tax=Rhododendron simsii TaxID=118357 RepID=A0A834FVZ9_RHOSS|nr:hypothetical protein RHSIM_RhsimUnG0072300 [Rhododendron simsii]
MSDSLVRVSRRVEWGTRRPTPGARSCQRHAETARAVYHNYSDDVSTGMNNNPGLDRQCNPHRSTPRVEWRTGLSPFHIRPRCIASPHPLPSRQFQALFDSLFKVLFIFPSRYLFAIGLSPVFSLGRNLPPDWGCIPKQPDSPTAPRDATGSGHDGALTLSGAPFQGTWARSVAEDASTDYNSNDRAVRFSSWADPGSLAVTKGILEDGTPEARSVSGGPGAPNPLLRFNFLGAASRRGLLWLAHVEGRRAHRPRPGRRAPLRTALPHCIRQVRKFSAGQVQWTSRDVAGGEPPTSPRSEHFTGPFNR